MISISDADFDLAVQAALDAIPDEFHRHLDNVIIEVRDRPNAALLVEHEVPEDLLGLYVGVPLEDKSVDLGGLPDRVLVFRDNLCEMCETRDELVHEIRVTVLHEIGHHFGLDEDRLAELGYE
jgi:predicted Zn-dependent protease with MMP-like domain